VGDVINVAAPAGGAPIPARIVAIDSRVDPATRNTMIRARVTSAERAFAPGAAVRVFVPYGPQATTAAVPVSALRRGPAGDHVFVIAPDSTGKTRAQVRPVKSGAVLGDEVLILDGVKPGEQVAASGSFKLYDGALVVTAAEQASR
jgi:membrane fusion protein, multidrug efflux system